MPPVAAPTAPAISPDPMPASSAAAALRARLARDAPHPADPDGLGDELRVLLAEAWLDLPLPAGGDSRTRWAALEQFAAADLSLARLAEGHTDGVAVLAEAGRLDLVGPRTLLGVWASGSGRTGLTGTVTGSGERRRLQLEGVLRYCSGARVLDAALVPVATDDGPVLVLLPTTMPGVHPLAGTWPATGMAGSESLDVRVAAAEVDEDAVVGPPGWYLARAGFWIGGIGVAACWAGGARGVVRGLAAGLRARDADPHQLAHLGGCAAALYRADAALDTAARMVDGGGAGDLRRLAHTVRAVVEQAVEEVLVRAARAGGPGPLVHDAVHARRVADLGVYVRQQHAERDLAAVGRAALDDDRWP